MNTNLDIFYDNDWIESYSHIYFLHKEYAIWGDAGVIYQTYVQVIKYNTKIIEYEIGETRVLTKDDVTLDELEFIVTNMAKLFKTSINDIDICRIA